MPPLWLLLDLHDMAAVTAGLFFTGSLVVAAFVAEFVDHHSTAETSVPEGTPAPSGTGLWVVESERRVSPADLPRDGSARAVAAVGPSSTRTPT
jgi:hypothetical protein